MSNVKKLWIGIGILVLLSPLGVILPALFQAEGGWGEWGLDQIGKIAGFAPEGMKRLAEIWGAHAGLCLAEAEQGAGYREPRLYRGGDHRSRGHSRRDLSPCQNPGPSEKA